MASPVTKPKQSKHPHYDDPSAFYQSFPPIEEVTDGSYHSPLASIRPVRYYKMGKCGVIAAEPFEGGGWFMSVQRTDRYPSWDEMVWLRYKLIPDAARMANILPNLNAYINREDTSYKFVFTMEQTGWVLDPQPLCQNPDCEKILYMQPEGMTPHTANFACASCDFSQVVDFNTWNEAHGNGATVPSSQTGVNFTIKKMTKGRLRIAGEAKLEENHPFDDIKAVMPNDSPFNRLDIIVLHNALPDSYERKNYRVFYIPGAEAFNPTAPILMEGDILLATLSIPSRWKSINDILITYANGEIA